MKPLVLALVGALALSACSQRDLCLDAASKELRVLSRLIQTTQGNLERGYAIGTREVPEERRRRCTVTQPDGSKITQICTRIVTRTKRFPVAIDLRAEQRKLDSLLVRQRLEQRRTASAQQACLAQYPEK